MDLQTLSPQLLLWGYRRGLFPMADDETDRIEWFSPDPRAIIDLQKFHVSQTLRQIIRQQRYRITVDQCFPEVIRACADRERTWINTAITEVYCDLHRTGYAHSLEAWQGEQLAGGLYGVAIGAAFFGESMFHHATDASKVALVALVQHLERQQFVLLDIQFLTSHLLQFGAITVSRNDYLEKLRQAIDLDREFFDGNKMEIPVMI